LPRASKRTKKVAERRVERARVREKPQQIADELRRLIVAGELSEGCL
jgi:DNA-binding GntR family transcriptional regulator